ncbi:type II toxin-antitoxin system mRNA interferase toxin, RelE/StbE family [Xenorhabdus bovienii]|uniref:Type II toxin-antitoxin system mRNA interferase toxin, RelE/StbE family n=3 Tax=Photorhabdus TaxID=29487 RepID=A0A7X5QQW3_9GAMM|nr:MULTISPECIES: type II toxin-antitoxin system mRNA interferase toxin, RelE/StbE family [Morganellaceae]ETS32010.1 addiction module toxin, RelE/StbE family [Photorhabdus khanii NC19]MDE1475916.1 type II toxin-antitoxin system mRNA interferase toxin, RelE/StbE family [Xenorhabdus bovienii]MDE1497474.1 type II toxin-antitoxin system mRNA interferase toxin, RelE/StbE family [Xenorhabdus bovienii]MDE9437123.1 type II toxin-antitoxin system mRNA interferase toxin, RelE/StbE family [Xenorhabdus bovi
MKIVWRPMAEADRENIFDYIAQDNPRAALELDEDFKAKVEIAARNPKLYKAGRVRGTREIVVRPNYVMVCRIEDESSSVIVLRVLHAAQQWPPTK